MEPPYGHGQLFALPARLATVEQVAVPRDVMLPAEVRGKRAPRAMRRVVEALDAPVREAGRGGRRRLLPVRLEHIDEHERRREAGAGKGIEQRALHPTSDGDARRSGRREDRHEACAIGVHVEPFAQRIEAPP